MGIEFIKISIGDGGLECRTGLVEELPNEVRSMLESQQRATGNVLDGNGLNLKRFDRVGCIQQLSEGNWQIKPNFSSHGNDCMVFVHGPDVIQTVGDAMTKLGFEVVGFDNVRFLGLIEKNHPIYVSDSKLPDESRIVNGQRILAKGEVLLADGSRKYYYVVESADASELSLGRVPSQPIIKGQSRNIDDCDNFRTEIKLSLAESGGGDFAVITDALLVLGRFLFERGGDQVPQYKDFIAKCLIGCTLLFQKLDGLNLQGFDRSQLISVCLIFNHDDLLEKDGKLFLNLSYKIRQGEKEIVGKLSSVVVNGV